MMIVDAAQTCIKGAVHIMMKEDGPRRANGAIPTSGAGETRDIRTENGGSWAVGGGSTNIACVSNFVRAVVRLVGHHMLIFVSYERGKVVYTHCPVITSHKLGRCVLQTATASFKQQ